MNDIIVPTIHLNGTSKHQLLNELTGALNALHLAIEAVQDAAPNGRDYYIQGPDAGAKAQAQHADRLARLASVRNELSEIAESI